MSLEFIILIIVVVAGFAALFWLLTKQKDNSQVNKEDSEKLVVMMEKISSLSDQNKELRQMVDSKLGESNRVLRDQFGQSTKIIQNVTERLTKLDETNKQVVNFTDQLQSLEQVLTNSKNRGNLGEAGLELILSNVLPPQSYQMQYHFKNNDAVDAVVKIKDSLLPVDAKFSLENYRRILGEVNKERKKLLEKEFKNDLKKRIDETAKYIRPDENTLDFAFMFIPAEGIYYDLLVNEVGAVQVDTGGLIDYAFKEKKVIIVSPTTFAAYLQTVLQGLKALEIEESAKEIQKQVEQLNRHLLSYEGYLKKLGNNLGTTVNMYNSAYKEFNKIDKDVVKIAGVEKKVEILELDKPKSDE